MAGSVKGDGTEEFKGLRITSLDDDSDEEEEQKEPDVAIYDDEEEEEDEEARNSVILGFLKKPKKSRSLLRHFFPSKAWLDPENLPSGRSCCCDICGEPLQFLLQVYAPEEKESAFHRALFVFMCMSMACLRRDQNEEWKCQRDEPSRSVKVFRCQLPCDNPFYSSEPPKKDSTEDPLMAGVASNNLWPEYNIIQEPENSYDTEMPDESVGTNSLVSSNRMDDGLMSIADNFTGDGDRKSWASFHVRIALAPEQILRYCRSSSAKP